MTSITTSFPSSAGPSGSVNIAALRAAAMKSASAKRMGREDSEASGVGLSNASTDPSSPAPSASRLLDPSSSRPPSQRPVPIIPPAPLSLDPAAPRVLRPSSRPSILTPPLSSPLRAPHSAGLPRKPPSPREEKEEGEISEDDEPTPPPPQPRPLSSPPRVQQRSASTNSRPSASPPLHRSQPRPPSPTTNNSSARTAPPPKPSFDGVMRRRISLGSSIGSGSPRAPRQEELKAEEQPANSKGKGRAEGSPGPVASAPDKISPSEAKQYMDIIRNLLYEGFAPEVLIRRGATAKYVTAVCEDIVAGTRRRKSLWMEKRGARADNETPSIVTRSSTRQRSPSPVIAVKMEMMRSVSRGSESSAEMALMELDSPPETKVTLKPESTWSPSPPSPQRFPIPASHPTFSQAGSSDSIPPIPLAGASSTLTVPPVAYSRQGAQAVKIESYTPGLHPPPPSAPRSMTTSVASLGAASLTADAPSVSRSTPPPSAGVPKLPAKPVPVDSYAAGPKAKRKRHLDNIALTVDPAPLSHGDDRMSFDETSKLALGPSLISTTRTSPDSTRSGPTLPAVESAAAHAVTTPSLAADFAASSAPDSPSKRKTSKANIDADVAARTALLATRRKALESMKRRRRQVQAAIVTPTDAMDFDTPIGSARDGSPALSREQERVIEEQVAELEKEMLGLQNETSMEIDDPEEGEIAPAAISSDLPIIPIVPTVTASLPIGSFPRGTKRPNAEDLMESRPSSLPVHLPPTKRLSVFSRVQRSHRLIINLDDSDSDSDEEVASGTASPMPGHSQTEAGKQRLLAEKEEGIRRLKEQIAAKLRAKEKRTMAGGDGGSLMPGEEIVHMAVEAVADMAAAEAEAVSPQIIIEAVEAMDIDPPPAPAPDPKSDTTVDTALGEPLAPIMKAAPPAQVTTTNTAPRSSFQAYQPLLKRYRQLASPTSLSPSFQQYADNNTTASANPGLQLFADMDHALLASIILTRRLQVDPGAIICPAESGGGTCADPTCDGVHLRRETELPADEALIEYAQHFLPGLKPEKAMRVLRQAKAAVAATASAPPNTRPDATTTASTRQEKHKANGRQTLGLTAGAAPPLAGGPGAKLSVSALDLPAVLGRMAELLRP